MTHDDVIIVGTGAGTHHCPRLPSANPQRVDTRAGT